MGLIITLIFMAVTVGLGASAGHYYAHHDPGNGTPCLAFAIFFCLVTIGLMLGLAQDSIVKHIKKIDKK
jgi:hypothetical protein